MNTPSQNRTSTNLLSLKEGATVAALAIFAPLALQGLLLALLWNLAQWGSVAETVVEGVTFTAGSTLNLGLAILIVLAIRYSVLAGYWLLIVERFSEPRKRAFLAAAPIVGLWWSLGISSRIARNADSPKRLTPEFATVTVGFTALTLLLLPLSMQVATANDISEVKRLASPCIQQFPGSAPEEPVLAVGSQGLDQTTFDTLVDEVVQGQRGAVAKVSEEWPTVVADQQVRMLLWRQAASRESNDVSVQDMDDQITSWREIFGGAAGLDEVLLEAGIPPSQLALYACAVQLSQAFAESNPFVETPDGSSEYEEALRAAATRLGVTVDPAIGYWDPETLSVRSEPPAPTEEQPVAQDTDDSIEPLARTFSTRVAYDIASIPTQEFADSLGWKADICAGATELLQDRFLDRVALYQRVAGRWVLVRDAQAEAQRGGRCNPGQVNLFIGSEEIEPPANWTDKGWRTCRDYQVRIPETPTFQAASVDMCVSTRADSTQEGV